MLEHASYKMLQLPRQYLVTELQRIGGIRRTGLNCFVSFNQYSIDLTNITCLATDLPKIVGIMRTDLNCCFIQLLF